jgi:TRAP-type C4-dicarboxylate transport system substrate-binding protein
MRGTLRFLALAAAFLIACDPAAAQTRWNLPSAYPADNPHTENLASFARDVAAATGGKLQIAVHPGASLFRAPEIKRAVQTGQAQMGEVLLSIHENEDALFGLDVVPFLVAGFSDAMKLHRASRPAIERKLAAQGIMVLFAVPWAPQGIYAKKDINTIADMKGLRWRVYNVGTSRIGEIVGAQGVTIQAAELPQALATGVVNSFMSSGGTGYDIKVWESLTHFHDVRAWIPKNYTLMNKAAFDALDKPTQRAILKAAETAEARGWQSWDDKTDWYLGQLRAKGMTVQPPGAELAAGLRAIGEQIAQDWLKKAGADGRAVLDAYRQASPVLVAAQTRPAPETPKPTIVQAVQAPPIVPTAQAPPIVPSVQAQSTVASVQALPTAQGGPDPVFRVALVVGNSSYKAATRLPNPARDAAAVAAALKSIGFQSVRLENDLTREKLVEALRDFAREAATADWAVVYFAGHGLEINGTNHLVPVDARLETDRDVHFETLPLDQVLTAVEGARKLRLVILDACRDNPFLRVMKRTVATRSIGRGLARVEPDGGTLVAYAAKGGEVALDGDGANSPFVQALLKHLPTPGLEIGKLFRHVRDDVMTATGRKQEPFIYGSLSSEDFYFVAKN